MATAVYYVGSALPDLAVTWADDTGAPIDFSGGSYQFTVTVMPQGSSTVVITKTTGITGTAQFPNVVIAWDEGEFSVLGEGYYTVRILATRGSDGKKRIASGQLQVIA